MKKVEILAPASSYNGLRAAICAGCDAVYVGGSQFSARAFANNLTEEAMLKAIDFVHIHNKHLYLTLNTLLKETELEENLYKYLEKYYRQGLDAVIVQDIGVLSFIHRYFPLLPIHVSTQMMLTGAYEAELLKNYGVTRIVTSRELSLEELKILRQNTDLEIEIFVHGALCYCYSGQCLMSSLIGGRSGNRGRCAQPCRKPYLLDEKKAYFLSPKDICALAVLPDLIEAKVDSFKIEGRMKSPEYAALTTYIYQKYTQLYSKIGKEDWIDFIEADQKKLLDLYNRGGFTAGYYFINNGKQMMAFDRPNHNGLLVGKVTSVSQTKASIFLQEDIFAYDLLEFRQNGEGIYTYTVKEGAKKGEIIQANFYYGSKIKRGALIYRIKNQNLLNHLEEDYLKKEKKETIKGKFIAKTNLNMELTLSCREFTIIIQGEKVLEAKNSPVTQQKVRKQLEKIKDTKFIFEELEIQMDTNLFFPISQLNELRREAIRTLEEKISGSYRRTQNLVKPKVKDKIKEKQEKINISVSVFTKQQWKSCVSIKEIDAIYFHIEYLILEEIVGIAKETVESGKKFYLILPHILREKEKLEWKKHLDIFKNQYIDGFIIKNIEEYGLVSDCKKEIILDYNMHIFNQEAKLFWKNIGVNRYTTSLELNKQELKILGCENSDFIVYGYLPLMVSAQCVVKNTKKCSKQSEFIIIKDSYEKDFYIKNYCNYCYNIIYNGIPLWLINQLEQIRELNPYSFRLDFTIEDKKETKQVLDDFISVSCYSKIIPKKEHFTKGHFDRGID